MVSKLNFNETILELLHFGIWSPYVLEKGSEAPLLLTKENEDFYLLNEEGDIMPTEKKLRDFKIIALADLPPLESIPNCIVIKI